MGQITLPFLAKILQMEGGFQDNSKDKANYACGKLVGTKYGVSAIAWQTWKKRCPTKSDIENLTESEAKEFYTWYMRFYRLDEIKDQFVFELVFNNVMGSPVEAGKALQIALNQFGYGLVVDGIIGSKTLAALNHAAAQNKEVAYNAIRQAWVDYLGGTNPDFRQGLLNRMKNHFPPLTSGNDSAVVVSADADGLLLEQTRSGVFGAIKGDKEDLIWIIVLLLPFGFAIWAVAKMMKKK
jgi:lysozyme family protein